MNEHIRWQQLFENLQKTFLKLQFAIKTLQEDTANELIQMAVIQSFEFSYELSWKTMKDFIAYQGIKDVSLPRQVIKHCFQHQIIGDGQVWIDMLEDRNLMAHAYDEKKAQIAIVHIIQHYEPAIALLCQYFTEQMSELP